MSIAGQRMAKRKNRVHGSLGLKSYEAWGVLGHPNGHLVYIVFGLTVKFLKSVSGTYNGLYIARGALYTKTKQSFIYFVATLYIGENINMSEHNNLNWKDFLLCLSMELAFGDGSRDNEVYRRIENIMSRMEYY